MSDYREPIRRPMREPMRIRNAKNIFYNTTIICGTAIVIAVTVKVIMSLFM